MTKRLAVLSLALVAACGSAPKKGGYYKDDGPGAHPPANLAGIPDARPRVEPLHRFANRPYEVFGRKYAPLASVQPFRQRGVASWYGKRFHGQKTASGEIYDMYAMTAAHPILPIPSYARVTSLRTGAQVVVRINDRGPFHAGRVIDLSYAAAYRLGLLGSGSGEVEIESVIPGRL
jgi:rare lipoprotein A